MLAAWECTGLEVQLDTIAGIHGWGLNAWLVGCYAIATSPSALHSQCAELGVQPTAALLCSLHLAMVSARQLGELNKPFLGVADTQHGHNLKALAAV